MERPRDLALDLDTLSSRKTHEHSSRILAELSDDRSPLCILCARHARFWVRGIAFEFAENKMLEFGPQDYPGPLPGLCLHHETMGAEDMAKGVYMDQPSARMMQPTKWRVSFTDGSKIEGHILSIIPEALMVEVQESFAPGQDQDSEETNT